MSLWNLSSLGAALAFSVVSMCNSAGAKQYLYVENGASGDVSVISIPEHEVEKVIPIGAPPLDDLVGSHDGKVVYVNRALPSEHSWGTPEAGEIVAVSTKTDEILWRLSIEDGWPHHLSISSGGLLYAPLFDRAYVVVIDTKTRKVVGRIDGQWGMHGTKLSSDDKRLYAGSILTHSMYVLDVEENKPINVFGFQDGVRPFAITADESIMYAQLSRLHGFIKADLETGEVLETVELPGLPDDFEEPRNFPFNVNHGLELSPDEKFIVAAGSVLNSVSVYTHPELEYVATIPVGENPNWVVFSLDGKYAYVGCSGSAEVSVISLVEMKEVKRIQTGGKGSARMRVVDVPARNPK